MTLLAVSRIIFLGTSWISRCDTNVPCFVNLWVGMLESLPEALVDQLFLIYFTLKEEMLFLNVILWKPYILGICQWNFDGSSWDSCASLLICCQYLFILVLLLNIVSFFRSVRLWAALWCQFITVFGYPFVLHYWWSCFWILLIVSVSAANSIFIDYFLCIDFTIYTGS